MRALGPIWRRTGFDGNPLRRPVDRLEAWCTLALVALALLAGPLVAWRVGAAVAGHSGAASFRFTRAVLTADAPAVTVGAAVAVAPQVPAPARWNAPDGSAHTGEVVVEAGTPAGTTVTVRTDDAGRIVDAGTGGSPAAVAGAAALAFAAALGCAWLVLRLLTDRHRMARWQRGWRRVEPRWRTAD